MELQQSYGNYLLDKINIFDIIVFCCLNCITVLSQSFLLMCIATCLLLLV